jgi:TolA-binding protein
MKSRRNWIFINFSWMLFVSLVWSYGFFASHFAASPEASFKVEQMEHELAVAHQEKAKLAYQFEDFRQNAALHWPEARKSNYRWPASITVDLSTSLYEKGRRLFQEKKWDESLAVFTQIITEFPYSKWVTEAQYYSCEINFQTRDLKATADCVSQMVEMFPESVLTGFQLIRLAQVHEINGQVEEALEVYRIIHSQFSEPILKTQSLESIKRLEKK